MQDQTKAKKKPLPRVEDRPYRTSHLKSPRGTGSWAFCPETRYRDQDYLDATAFFTGTYGEAKKQAREHFAGAATTIVTLP